MNQGRGYAIRRDDPADRLGGLSACSAKTVWHAGTLCLRPVPFEITQSTTLTLRPGSGRHHTNTEEESNALIRLGVSLVVPSRREAADFDHEFPPQCPREIAVARRLQETGAGAGDDVSPVPLR